MGLRHWGVQVGNNDTECGKIVDGACGIIRYRCREICQPKESSQYRHLLSLITSCFMGAVHPLTDEREPIHVIVGICALLDWDSSLFASPVLAPSRPQSIKIDGVGVGVFV
jgi:hypothetical protein